MSTVRPTTDHDADAAPRGVKRPLSDWVGFLFCLGLAVHVFSGAGGVTLLVLPPLMLELFAAATFLLRGRARGSLTGFAPRAAAYGSGLIVLVFVWAASKWAPGWVPMTNSESLRFAGMSLWLFGAVLSLWPMWQLRRSFSIEPAARELVTSGPYRFARHPIYASFLFTYSGMLLLRPSVPHAVVFVAWLVLTRIRIGYEERVLLGAFPEYAAYRERVGAFGPKLMRSRTPRPEAAGPAA